MKLTTFASITLLLVGSAWGQNKANLPILMNWVTPKLSSNSTSWRTVTYVEFQGYWVPDGAKGDYNEGKGVISKSLYKCHKKTMSCEVVNVATGLMVISLDTMPVQVWNEHRIVIEDDEIDPSTPCPVISSTVVDIDGKLIRGSETPLTARWNTAACKPLTPEIATSTETLAGIGDERTAGTFFAW